VPRSSVRRSAAEIGLMVAIFYHLSFFYVITIIVHEGYIFYKLYFFYGLGKNTYFYWRRIFGLMKMLKKLIFRIFR